MSDKAKQDAAAHALSGRLWEALVQYPLIAAMWVTMDFFIAGCKAEGIPREAALHVLGTNLASMAKHAGDHAWPFTGPRAEHDLTGLGHMLNSMLIEAQVPPRTAVIALTLVCMRLTLYRGVEPTDILEYIDHEWDAVESGVTATTTPTDLFRTKKIKPMLNGLY